MGLVVSLVFGLIQAPYCLAADCKSWLFQTKSIAEKSAWAVHSWDGAMAVASPVDSQEVEGRNGVVRFEVLDEPGKAILRKLVPAASGCSYKVSILLRAANDTRVTLRVRKNSADYKVWGQRSVIVGPIWQQVEFVAAPDQDAMSRLEIDVMEPNAEVYTGAVMVSAMDDHYSTASTRESNVVSPLLFGMHVNKGHIQDLWRQLSSIHIGAIRLWDTGTDWASVEGKRERYDWRRFDLYISRIKRYLPEAKIIYTFGRVPLWANSGEDTSSPPLQLEDWQRFVRTLVDRYGMYIDYYEIWNEFNYKGFWSGSLEEMLELHRASYKIIRAMDPTAKIVLPNISSTGLDILDRYLGMGGGTYADIASVHMYVQFDDIEGGLSFVHAVRDVMDAHGYGEMPLWNSEGAVQFGTKHLKVEQIRSGVARYYIMSWMLALDNAGWYFWENNWSIGRIPFVEDDGTYSNITQAAIAYREISEWIVGTSLSWYEPLQSTDRIYEIQVTVKGKVRGWIVWSLDSVESYCPEYHSRVQSYRLLDGTSKNLNVDCMKIDQEPVFLEYAARAEK